MTTALCYPYWPVQLKPPAQVTSLPMDSFVQGRFKTDRWQCCQSWAPLLLGSKGLRLSDWLANEHVEIIKHGPHRSVYRVTLHDREFYLKHFRCHTIWDRARHLFRHSQARREWKKAKAVAKHGIATIRPIAWQEEKGRGLVGNSFLVTEAIPDSCSVDEYFRHRLHLLPPEEQGTIRRRLLVEFARFVAQIHQAGIDHNDLHPGNVVLSLNRHRPLEDQQTGQYCLHLIDVPSVQLRRPLTWPNVLASFVVLNAAWRDQLTQTDRYRFWKAYRAARPQLKLPPLPKIARQLELHTQAHCRRRLQRRDRRTLRTCHDYVALKTTIGQAHGLTQLPDATLRDLATSPGTLLRENIHQPVKLDHGSVIVHADLPLDDRTVHIAYKRYRPRKWWKVFLAPFRPARAVQSWQRGHALKLRGISAARPVAAVDRRRPWYRCESYLAVEWIENSENLHLYLWRIANQPDKIRIRQANRCAESLGRLLGRMHTQRVLHGDLKASNLLITDHNGQIESHLVDVDDVTLDIDTTLSRRATDLARLAASLEAHPWVPRTTRLRFLRAYVKESRRHISDWKPLWHAIAKRTEPITRRKRRKKQAIL